MSRSIIRKKNSPSPNNNSDEDGFSSGLSRPTSAPVNNTQTKSDDDLSDKSTEFKMSNKHSTNQSNAKSSFFARITGSVKYSSESDNESLTRTPPLDRSRGKSNNYKDKFSRPDSHLNDSESDSESSAASDKPAPKTNLSLRSNSVSSEQRKSKNSNDESKKKAQRKERSSSSSSFSSNSSLVKSESLISNKKSIKSNYRSSDSDDYSYRPNSGHVTKVKLEKKPPIDKSKWNNSGGKLSSRPSSQLEKPNDSMSDSSDTRRSNSITESTSKSNTKHRIDNRLNQTFDLDLDNSENEITDVSPLPTPKMEKSKSKPNIGSKPKQKEPRRNSMDMSAFYKVLNEDINKRIDSVFSIFNNDKFNKVIRKSSLKTSFDLKPVTDSKITEKINKIEAENQRLYEKLMNTSTNNSKIDRFNKPIRLTSSALNRQREQQRIEKENQQILKRLLKVKATKYLVKEEQIKDYEKNFGNITLNCSRINSMPSGFSSSAACINDHNLSFVSRRSGKSTVDSSLMPSRISSAKSTSKSRSSNIGVLDPNELLKRANSVTRLKPQWCDRF